MYSVNNLKLRNTNEGPINMKRISRQSKMREGKLMRWQTMGKNYFAA